MNKKIAIIGGAGFIGHNLGMFLKKMWLGLLNRA